MSLGIIIDYTCQLHLSIIWHVNIAIGNFNCVNENRIGVTSKVIDSIEAYDKTLDYYRLNKNLFSTIGIAGPGDYLANFDELYEFFGFSSKTSICQS